ncbi:ESX secretion-associated protein EspG [Actinokineospora globicatena]|uniref:ESX secretion-associated protein EspG n=1 Tax=Actinokineospora globicatena TaxID=103729 RepID=UPI0020A567F9|nr:ESX secretion-associated protein EspG [Actinokineospora globicatena]MCP2301440.1 EspG family protein [Actinokineospora globicatena]GLW76921.1 ESX secretion-associated protein EspG [Actinokineospora globicatena]GLW83754.1 ESX secretion-associated protein EspG [Actinokineospora globicatena]
MSASIVLSALEFDVLWESERLPLRHVAIDVPSPGMTHSERARLVAGAFADLERRGLASRGRAEPEVADRLSLLAHAQVSVDVWVWTDREIKALAVMSGDQAGLAVVDNDQVWLIPARTSALAEAAVSVTGDAPAGPGRSVSLLRDVLIDADRRAGGEPHNLVTPLQRAGLALYEAQSLALMFSGVGARGQFGVERVGRDQRKQRADRVVAFHDTNQGRYVHVAKHSNDGQVWSTVAPADNARLAAAVWDLLDDA